jgi:hypothetical protein
MNKIKRIAIITISASSRRKDLDRANTASSINAQLYWALCYRSEAAEHIVDTICTFSSLWQRPCSALWLTILSHKLSQIKISKAKQIAACRRLANFVRQPKIMHREECDSFVPSPILWFVVFILGDECSDDLHVQSDEMLLTRWRTD